VEHEGGSHPESDGSESISQLVKAIKECGIDEQVFIRPRGQLAVGSDVEAPSKGSVGDWVGAALLKDFLAHVA